MTPPLSRTRSFPAPALARVPLAWGLGLLLALPVTAQRDPSASSFPEAGRSGMGGLDGSVRVDPVPIFFPPHPPPLGRPINRSAPAPGRLAAPPELAAFVNEVFYPPLGTRLATKTLSEKLRGRVEGYRAMKVALQAELRAELDRVRNLDPMTRAGELETFARRQAPRLAELENSAEQLRRELISGGQTWGALRQWRLGDRERRGFSPLEIAQVMRAYAYYQDGLLPAQRRLLREIAIELMMASDSTENATLAQPYVFFPPEPARVLLPDDLPDEVIASLSAYQTKKSLLKKQLYDAVYEYDGRRFGFLRPNSLKALAETQAAPLAELDQLAEAIRRGLGQVAEPATLAERTPLPPLLHHRVAVLMTSYSGVQQEATGRLEAILADARDLPMQTSYRFDGEGLRFVVVPTRGGRGGRGGPPPSPEDLARITAIRTQFNEIAEDYARRVADLVKEKDAIAAEVSRTLGSTRAAAVDSALLAATRVIAAKATESSYREYRLAVFQPGLSPAQRRLLFDGVIEQLDLPLPRGEPQPINRAATW